MLASYSRTCRPCRQDFATKGRAFVRSISKLVHAHTSVDQSVRSQQVTPRHAAHCFRLGQHAMAGGLLSPKQSEVSCALQALASKRLQRLFYESRLPNSVGASIRLDTEESKHAARVLRLPVSTEVELYNGLGELVTGRITGVDKSAVSVITTTAAQQVE